MGNFPNRQVLVSSSPMDHKSTQSILGWFQRANFVQAPKAEINDKFYYMGVHNVDLKEDHSKDIVKYFHILEYKKAIDEFTKIEKDCKGRCAGILVGG